MNTDEPDLGHGLCDDYMRGRDDGFRIAMIAIDDLFRSYFDHMDMNNQDIMSILKKTIEELP